MNDQALAKIDIAKAALAEAKTIQEVKRIVDLAEAARVYAQRSRAGKEVEMYAVEISVLAERKLGEMLTAAKAQGSLKEGQPSKKRTVDADDSSLVDLGITRDLSSRAQAIASIPVSEFNDVVRTKCENGTLSRKAILREVRENAYKRKVAEIGANAPMVAGNYELIHADLRDALIKPESIDAIVTDPPYERKTIDCYAWLAECAARWLKPGASAFIMSGHIHFPDVLDRLRSVPRFNYQWILCYQLPKDNSVCHPRHVYIGWKPVLWFVKDKYDGPYFGDTPVSDFEDERFHKWGQTVSGLFALVERISQPGQTVLDPFCGGGSTGVACYLLNRRFIGIDLDKYALATTATRLHECQQSNGL